MSEMALTADHLILIGLGRLLADTSVEGFVSRSSGGWVQVRSPNHHRLAQLLRGHGAATEDQHDGTLTVRGISAAAVGDLAARHGIALHELVARQASLEEALCS